ncbi:hypothetical protein BGZ70_000532 [Mortierella alpina]|uniref:CCD97-like C-terminal domain-containing protein n=1 Tax=Mortierella alpina TaxID=64518 RepID=A0A9P6J0X0_MORAP|nr:hypothetical protein BGZ70_000532 [Mortierella alpina]
MSLAPAAIDTILHYLDPHLDNLQTGFPTSTRPNEPTLIKDQKRLKIKTTLANDPGIFLTKWGAVILYPRAETTPAENHESDGSVHANQATATAKDILDLFAPLAVDYEIKYHLTRLYQQLQRLSEHASYEAAKRLPSGTNTTTDPHNLHQHNYAPAPSNFMEIEQDEPTLSKDIPEEDRKPNPGQSDLFTRSTLSQHTRRNRRLNYLLRHLAPPDASESIAAATAAGIGKGKGRSTGSVTGRTGAGLNATSHHPALASILSISGSMSNLSFSESTYFSDAEMEARAPELYQQYIGRFMDQDDDDHDGDEEDGGTGGVRPDTGQTELGPGSLWSAPAQPFAKDVGLVDRILWNVDHPSSNERQKELERRLWKQGKNAASSGRQQRSLQQHARDQGSLNSVPAMAPQPTEPRAPHLIPANVAAVTALAAQDDDEFVEEFDTDSEAEFKEEFDTESEDEDSEMVVREETDGNGSSKNDRKGPLKNVADDEILARTSVTPPIPPDPVPEFLSSTLSSAAMALEQPEERALFAEIENGDDLDSDDGKEMDQATAERKEDQEALRQDFVLLMKQRFLDGLDINFDYSLVDFDEELDDLEQEDHDEEDRWFDGEDGDENQEGSGARRSYQRAHMLPASTTYDECVRVWENSAQNGSGEYDY